MKKIAVFVLSVLLFASNIGITIFASADDRTYKYERTEAEISDVVYQDYEDYDAMEDWSKDTDVDASGRVHGFFSFMGIDPDAGVFITDKEPISGDLSMQMKGRIDARRWTIDTEVPFYTTDSDGYVMEFRVRFDTMPAGSSFALKISDVNSQPHDNENAENPIISFSANDNGKVSLKNLSGTELAVLDMNKAYMVSVVCSLDTSDYYVFLDEQYIPASHSEFNCDFSQVSAIRYDLTSGAEITIDDILIDGCDIKTVSDEETPAPATPSEDTAEPTGSDSGNGSGSANGSQTVTPKPAAATPTAAGDVSGSGNVNIKLIIIIAIAALIVVAAVVIILVAVKSKKKKKKK